MLETLIQIIGSFVLPYLVLSIFAMLIIELIALTFRLRARTLHKCVRRMLADDDKLTDELYRHPIIESLSPGRSRPDYIPSRLFALALVDTIRRGGEPDNKGDALSLDEAIRRLESGTLRGGLRAILRGAPPWAAEPLIQNWFLNVMDQASGMYRRQTMFLLLFVALAIVVPTNFDAIRISNYVAERDITEKAVQAIIEAEAKRPTPAPPGAELASQKGVASLHALAFPIGWPGEMSALDFGGGPGGRSLSDWLFLKAAGLACSMLAIMLGAPFLFDTLNRYMIVRSAVKPFDEFAVAPSTPPPAD